MRTAAELAERWLIRDPASILPSSAGPRGARPNGGFRFQPRRYRLVCDGAGEDFQFDATRLESKDNESAGSLSRWTYLAAAGDGSVSVVLVRPTGRSTWVMPKGHLEAGERCRGGDARGH